jgi:hypothetical protein
MSRTSHEFVILDRARRFRRVEGRGSSIRSAEGSIHLCPSDDSCAGSPTFDTPEPACSVEDDVPIGGRSPDCPVDYSRCTSHAASSQRGHAAEMISTCYCSTLCLFQPMQCSYRHGADIFVGKKGGWGVHARVAILMSASFFLLVPRADFRIQATRESILSSVLSAAKFVLSAPKNETNFAVGTLGAVEFAYMERDQSASAGVAACR